MERVFLVSGKPANLLGAVLGAVPDGLELQGLKVAKADFSAKPGTALCQPLPSYCAVYPPSTMMSWPVMNAAPGELSQSTALAISSPLDPPQS